MTRKQMPAKTQSTPRPKKPGSVPKKFQRLYRALTQGDTKIVVSLGGGGARMFAHPVVFDFLEQLGVASRIDEVWGASGGAIMGSLYACGMSPSEMKEDGIKVASGSHKVPRAPSPLKSAANMIQDLFRPIEKRTALKGFQDCQRGIFKIVQERMQNRNLKIPFYCTAYNMDRFENDILTPQAIPDTYAGNYIYSVDLFTAVNASSSIPVIFKPVAISEGSKTHKYVDGAMIEEVPLASLYRKWQLDRQLQLEKRRRLIVIAVFLYAFPTGLQFLDHWLIRRLPGYEYIFLSMNYADFMRKARQQAQKQPLLEDPMVELWEIHLGMTEGSILDFNIIPKVIKHAEREFPKQFAEINRNMLG